jgi:parvulin-like peptidyl-prolyl isomerase
LQDYAMALREEGRKRFYHGQPPEGELPGFYRDTANQLVNRSLALGEARRHGLRIDRGRIDAELEQARQRTAGHARATPPDEAFWARLRQRLEEEQLVAVLRQQVEASVRPSDAAVRGYYQRYPDKFTEPARLRVSVILLRVEPSAPPATWQAARDEAATLVKRLRQGADFAELARLHSGDPSASRGGDMGYLHEGMLAPNLQAPLGQLVIGQVSDPVTVLEGVAVFRVDERKPPRRVDYAEVRNRAQSLWLQEERQRAWSAFLGKLRDATPVTINEKYLVPGSVPGRGIPVANAVPAAERGR